MLEFKITHLKSYYSRKREITLNESIKAIKWNSNARLPEIITETNSFPRTSPLRDHLKWLQLYKKIFGEESKNPSPAHCNLQFLNTRRCGLHQMIKKMNLILLIVKQIWTKTAHRTQTNDSVRRRPPTNNSKCPWKCAIENLAKALIKENQTHVKKCYCQRLQ